MRILDRATSRLPRPWRTLADWAITIVIAIAVVLVFEAEVAKPFEVPTSSMEPTLHCARPSEGCEAHFSDRVIACELCYELSSPSRGSIVVFHAPPEAAEKCGTAGVYVKRLIGMPGDRLREDDAGYLWVDGRRLDEPYVTAAARAEDTEFRGTSWTVPKGDYFMLGDNRGGSCDSRMWGPVPRKSLIGPVVATYWPLTRLSIG